MDKQRESQDESDTETPFRPRPMWPWWRKDIMYTAIGKHSQHDARSRWHANTTLVVVFLMLLTSALSIWGTMWWQWHHRAQLCRHSLQQDINGFVPVVQEKSVHFMNDERWEFVEHPTEKEEEALTKNWASLIPNGRGFVELHNKTAGIDLPPPLVYEKRKAYGVAVFHQLHCLRELGLSLNELVHGQPLSMDLQHTYHCIEYLRQVVQCTSDTTLEGMDSLHKTKHLATTGWGTTHICKDFDAVFAWTEQNAFANTQASADQ